jgi:hypothetical protein
MAKASPTLKIELSTQESAELREIAIRHKTSPAALVRLATRHLLAQVRRGATPLIQPSTDQTGIIPEGWERGSEGLTVISTGPTPFKG